MKCPDNCGLDIPEISGFGKVGAQFAHMQDMDFKGWKMRMYNVTGEHKLAGSTVSVFTLVELGIPIVDICEAAIMDECMKYREYMKETGGKK